MVAADAGAATASAATTIESWRICFMGRPSRRAGGRASARVPILRRPGG
jgi:hypothetical protein